MAQKRTVDPIDAHVPVLPLCASPAPAHPLLHKSAFFKGPAGCTVLFQDIRIDMVQLQALKPVGDQSLYRIRFADLPDLR